jgi:hypothetical protein
MQSKFQAMEVYTLTFELPQQHGWHKSGLNDNALLDTA